MIRKRSKASRLIGGYLPRMGDFVVPRGVDQIIMKVIHQTIPPNFLNILQNNRRNEKENLFVKNKMDRGKGTINLKEMG